MFVSMGVIKTQPVTGFRVRRRQGRDRSGIFRRTGCVISSTGRNNGKKKNEKNRMQ